MRSRTCLQRKRGRDSLESKFEIVENLLVIPSGKSYQKELNRVSWNGRDPVYDLRGWNEDHTQMTKGITFSHTELMELAEKLGGIKL